MENSRAYFSEGEKKELNILLGQDVNLSSEQVVQWPLSFGVAGTYAFVSGTRALCYVAGGS